MPELPEIYNLSRQMKRVLNGKKIVGIEVRQEKCLNLKKEVFILKILNHIIKTISSHGKWIFIGLDSNIYILLNLGMGGNVIFHKNNDSLPQKYQIKIEFEDESYLTIAFWWFGYFHLVKEELLDSHKMTCNLGISPIDETKFSYKKFCDLLEGRRGRIKSLLLNQKYIAGIGNVYIQDILFRAGIHPCRKADKINERQKQTLYNVICDELKQAVQLGGIAAERDLYNKPGKKFDFLVGYNEGKSCPVCGTIIEKISVGNTASYICNMCQK